MFIVPGLQNDFSISSLLAMGFTTIYNHTYDHLTTDSQILELKNKCTANSVLCVGGGIKEDDNMRVVACGDCFSILTATDIDTPNYVGSAYWYYTPSKSFGFAPNHTIHQLICDYIFFEDNLRLCWHTDNVNGGWRLGNILGLSSETGYSKYVFLKNSKNKVFLLKKKVYVLIR